MYHKICFLSGLVHLFSYKWMSEMEAFYKWISFSWNEKGNRTLSDFNNSYNFIRTKPDILDLSSERLIKYIEPSEHASNSK